MKIFISLFIVSTFYFNLDLLEVRVQYNAASKSKENSNDFYAAMSKYTSENFVLLAYKGASTTLKAKFSSDLMTKKKMFIEGAKMIEHSVEKDKMNPEIRLVRLSIQENTPKFLKYNLNIEEDKKLIISTFDKQNKSLKDYIKMYVKQSTVFSEKEKSTLLN